MFLIFCRVGSNRCDWGMSGWGDYFICCWSRCQLNKHCSSFPLNFNFPGKKNLILFTTLPAPGRKWGESQLLFLSTEDWTPFLQKEEEDRKSPTSQGINSSSLDFWILSVPPPVLLLLTGEMRESWDRQPYFERKDGCGRGRCLFSGSPR